MLSVRRRDSAIARYVRARAATSATCEYLSTRIRNWFRASANRPRAYSLCARSKAITAADSSCVGGLGGGGVGLRRTARTAACFCVVLTLETGAAFFGVGLRAAGLGAAFFALTADLDLLAALFLVAADFTALRATGLAAAALRAFGLEAGFVLTARFALFAAGLTFERDVDRLRPFVRLLLMGGNLKRLLTRASSPWNWPAAYHRHTSRSTNTTICGCFTTENPGHGFDKCANKEKHLMVIVGYVKVLFGLWRLNPPRQSAPTEEVTSFSFKNLQSAETGVSGSTLQGNIPPRPSTKSRTN